jgi:macrolide transport system ATP-binding/permease protein
MPNKNQLLSLDRVSFVYDGRSLPVLDRVSLALRPGWTCVAGANGSGKSSFALLACGLLESEGGLLIRPEPAVYCAQRVVEPPAPTGELFSEPDAETETLREILGVGLDWRERWASLSLGERRRFQLWAALASGPELLALDEPTNHLDSEAKAVLLSALGRFRGVGILVSHDRDFADALCRFTLIAPSWRLIEAPLSRALDVAEAEDEAVRRKQSEGRAEVERLRETANAKRKAAAKSERAGSKRGLDPRDHDGRGRINRARNTGRDAVAGRLKRRMDDRVVRAEVELAHLEVPGRRKQGTSIPSAVSKRDSLAVLEPGTIALGPDRLLEIPELRVGPRDRIGITGANGSGKSTLVRRLVEDAGARGLDFAYFPQDLGESAGLEALERIRESGRAELGRVLSELYRLGSDPESILESSSPSPGETRKLLLAEAFARGLPLIVADELTNHLDLPALLSLERALADFGGALVLVSHDQPFLKATCGRIWAIGDGSLRTASIGT